MYYNLNILIEQNNHLYGNRTTIAWPLKKNTHTQPIFSQKYVSGMNGIC